MSRTIRKEGAGEGVCNRNTKADPTGKNNHEDYLFCSNKAASGAEAKAEAEAAAAAVVAAKSRTEEPAEEGREWRQDESAYRPCKIECRSGAPESGIREQTVEIRPGERTSRRTGVE